MATVPLLLLNIVNGENYAERQEKEAGQRLEEAATAIREDMEDSCARHQTAVRALSRSITSQGRFDLDALNGWLQQTRQVYPGFQSHHDRQRGRLPDRSGSRNRCRPGNSAQQQPGDAVPDSATMRDREYFKRTVAIAAVRDLGRIYKPGGAAADGGRHCADFHARGELFGVIVGTLDLSPSSN